MSFKRIIKIFFAFFAVISFTSCDFKYEPITKQKNKELSLKILKCLDEKDKDGLKSLFATSINVTSDDIDDIFNYYTDVSIGFYDCSAEGDTILSGDTYFIRYLFFSFYIYTTTIPEEKADFYYDYRVTGKWSPTSSNNDLLGIHELRIVNTQDAIARREYIDSQSKESKEFGVEIPHKVISEE